MKRLACVGALYAVAALAGCGAPPPRSPSPRPAVVEVKPPQREAPVQETQAVAEAAPPDRATVSIDDCAERIREGTGLPATGADRALYDNGLAAERAGNMAEARSRYFELVQKMPASPYIPLTYLAFGELFRKRAEKQPSMTSLAVQAYKKVASFPPPRNTAYAYALYRMAEVQQQSNPAQALNSYLHTIKSAGNSLCPDVLGRAAKDGIVATYLGVGRPDRAWALFRHAAPDDATAADMLASLVKKYDAAGRAGDGCKAVGAAGNAALQASEQLATAASRCGKALQP